MHPLVGCALAHPAEASMPHLEGRGFEVDQDEAPAIFRRRSGTVLLHGKAAGSPGFPIEPPRGHIPTVSPLTIPLVSVISRASNEHPVWRSHGQEAKRGPPSRAACIRMYGVDLKWYCSC